MTAAAPQFVKGDTYATLVGSLTNALDDAKMQQFVLLLDNICTVLDIEFIGRAGSFTFPLSPEAKNQLEAQSPTAAAPEVPVKWDCTFCDYLQDRWPGCDKGESTDRAAQAWAEHQRIWHTEG